jgi:hypothetical protein
MEVRYRLTCAGVKRCTQGDSAGCQRRKSGARTPNRPSANGAGRDVSAALIAARCSNRQGRTMEIA